jgi:hypothetical protein
MSTNRFWAISLVALCASSLSVVADAAPQPQTRTVTAGDASKAKSYGLENPEVRRGYEVILAAIASVPAQTGKRTQYQAQIAYALDQALLDCPTTLAALDMASRQPGFARPTYGALRDVITAAARCDVNGIAQIDGGPAGLRLGAGPGTGFGGGSSNYGS